MEWTPFSDTSQAESLKSSGAATIGQRLEECLIYIRDKKRVYVDIYDMAIDFGKHGTPKFFPLPLLVALIDQDYRFKPYLADSRMARF